MMTHRNTHTCLWLAAHTTAAILKFCICQNSDPVRIKWFLCIFIQEANSVE